MLYDICLVAGAVRWQPAQHDIRRIDLTKTPRQERGNQMVAAAATVAAAIVDEVNRKNAARLGGSVKQASHGVHTGLGAIFDECGVGKGKREKLVPHTQASRIDARRTTGDSRCRRNIIQSPCTSVELLLFTLDLRSELLPAEPLTPLRGTRHSVSTLERTCTHNTHHGHKIASLLRRCRSGRSVRLGEQQQDIDTTNSHQ